ncbi:MAG: DUF357 domain-containing protein [Candidatus Diapherotrites archaeon]|jgi:uncharacterized protein|uniref:DUF357 domain-containing protein n=1 Tax=Candidatus Iainarchaeum sp. TaxID=3101447 RepID=A0A8T5GEP2_9ARCH|nr:DUF357 domain-containing protein [Candidatus Diapherotrites archaeon]MBT7241305.1 DUF357 domain-containing protein [Candidatus Diapherotrites archaeon]
MVEDKELIKKVEKYESLTKRALDEIKKRDNLTEKEEKIAKDFLSMANNYYNDASYYQKKGDLLTALASFSYAHAWLDAGVRAYLFDATDDQLFTLRE